MSLLQERIGKSTLLSTSGTITVLCRMSKLTLSTMQIETFGNICSLGYTVHRLYLINRAFPSGLLYQLLQERPYSNSQAFQNHMDILNDKLTIVLHLVNRKSSNNHGSFIQNPWSLYQKTPSGLLLLLLNSLFSRTSLGKMTNINEV